MFVAYQCARFVRIHSVPVSARIEVRKQNVRLLGVIAQRAARRVLFRLSAGDAALSFLLLSLGVVDHDVTENWLLPTSFQRAMNFADVEAENRCSTRC